MFLNIKQCTHAKKELFEMELIICIKMDLALNKLQRLICHKTQTYTGIIETIELCA